jgi:hypothetical protein
MGLCAALAFAYSRWAGDGGENLWLRGTLCLLAGLVFAFLHRADLKDLLGRIRKPVGDDVRSL